MDSQVEPLKMSWSCKLIPQPNHRSPISSRSSLPGSLTSKSLPKESSFNHGLWSQSHRPSYFLPFPGPKNYITIILLLISFRLHSAFFSHHFPFIIYFRLLKIWRSQIWTCHGLQQVMVSGPLTRFFFMVAKSMSFYSQVPIHVVSPPNTECRISVSSTTAISVQRRTERETIESQFQVSGIRSRGFLRGQSRGICCVSDQRYPRLRLI